MAADVVVSSAEYSTGSGPVLQKLSELRPDAIGAALDYLFYDQVSTIGFADLSVQPHPAELPQRMDPHVSFDVLPVGHCVDTVMSEDAMEGLVHPVAQF